MYHCLKLYNALSFVNFKYKFMQKEEIDEIKIQIIVTKAIQRFIEKDLKAKDEIEEENEIRGDGEIDAQQKRAKNAKR